MDWSKYGKNRIQATTKKAHIEPKKNGAGAAPKSLLEVFKKDPSTASQKPDPTITTSKKRPNESPDGRESKKLRGDSPSGESQRPTTGGKTINEAYWRLMLEQREKMIREYEVNEPADPDETSIDDTINADDLAWDPSEVMGITTETYPWEGRFPAGRTWYIERSKTVLSLPREIRKRIYTYALFPRGVEGNEPSPAFSANNKWRCKVPALLQCAYNVREEALPLWYDEFEVGVREPMDAKMWLSSIGREARAALGGIVVPFDREDEEERTVEEQKEGVWEELRRMGVEVRKEIIEMR